MNEQEIRVDERARIAGILDSVAGQPDTDPDRALIFRGIADILRIPTDDLIRAGLVEICEEIRADQGAALTTEHEGK